jgi:hypothetical protein
VGSIAASAGLIKRPAKIEAASSLPPFRVGGMIPLLVIPTQEESDFGTLAD